jgi:glutamate/tyrosine decarboxylase-like PLP-dependent enzyme
VPLAALGASLDDDFHLRERLHIVGADMGTWADNPTATELELETIDAFARAAGIPGRFTWHEGPGCGVVVSHAEEALLTALAAARQLAATSMLAESVKQFQKPGIDSRLLSVYCNSEQRGFVRRVCRLAGIDRIVSPALYTNGDTREEMVMDLPGLGDQLEEDIARGYRPLMLIAAFGSRSTLAVDNAEALAALARRHGVWLHVDATFAACEALREPAAFGDCVRDAHSVAVGMDNCFGSGTCLWYSDRRNALAAFRGVLEDRGPCQESAMPAALEQYRFLVNTATTHRTLEVAIALTHRDALLRLVTRQHATAVAFADMVRGSTEFTLLRQPRFSTVVFRAVMVPRPEMERCIASLASTLRVSSAVVDGVLVLQCCFQGHECADPPRETARRVFGVLRDALAVSVQPAATALE